MVSTSQKVKQILRMVQELSHHERVGLIQQVVQMFLPTAGPTPVQKNHHVQPLFSEHPQREQMLREQAAFDDMLDNLQSAYLNHYVAIHKGKLVDHDADIVALTNRTSEVYPEQIVLVRQVRSEPEPELQYRSPRFATGD